MMGVVSFGKVGVGTFHFSTGFEEMQLEQVKPGLAQFFVHNAEEPTEFIENTLEIKWDRVRHKQNRAAMLKRVIGGFNTGDNQKVNKVGIWNTKGSPFPQITSAAAIQAEQLFNRVPFEKPGGEIDTERRMRHLSDRLYKQCMDDIANTFVVKGWETIRTGKMTFDDGTGDYFNYDRATNNDAVAGAYWDNPATDWIGEVDAQCNIIQDNGGNDVDFIMPGGGTWEAMRKSTQAKDEADILQYDFIAFGDPKRKLPALPADLVWMVEDAKLIYQDWVRTYAGRNLYIFTSNERVTEPGAATKTMLMPDGEVLLGFSGSKCCRKFGPNVGWGNKADEMETASRMGIDVQSPEIVVSSQLNGLLDSRMFHVLTKPTDQVTYFDLKTHPLFIPKNADNFGLITETLTP